MLGGEAEAWKGKTKRHVKYFCKSDGKPFVVQSVSCSPISIFPSVLLVFKSQSFGSVHSDPRVLVTQLKTIFQTPLHIDLAM